MKRYLIFGIFIFILIQTYPFKLISQNSSVFNYAYISQLNNPYIDNRLNEGDFSRGSGNLEENTSYYSTSSGYGKSQWDAGRIEPFLIGFSLGFSNYKSGDELRGDMPLFSDLAGSSNIYVEYYPIDKIGF